MTELDKKNLEVLLEGHRKEYLEPDLCPELYSIKIFTSLSNFKINLYSFGILSNFWYKIKRTKNGYTLKKNGKNYQFTLLSDEHIQTRDKEMLKNIGIRESYQSLLRTLKLASSKRFIDSKIIIASSNDLPLTALMEFTRDNKRMIIDYVNNIVMDKNEYYDLFDVKVINEIDEVDLYKIWKLWQEYDFSLYYLLFYTKEIFKELGKTDEWLVGKYSKDGDHVNYYYMYGDDSDFMFFDKDDFYRKNALIIEEISEFTENPNIKSTNIHYSENDKKYYYTDKDRKIGFCLMSDCVTSNEIKKELLSEERYGNCHKNAIIVQHMLRDKNNAYLVNGLIKINDIDDSFHSWVELEVGSKCVVYDYNHNLIMNRDDYYDLFEATAINRTDKETIDAVGMFSDEGKFYLHPMTLGYFSQELLRDFKKNEDIILRK